MTVNSDLLANLVLVVSVLIGLVVLAYAVEASTGEPKPDARQKRNHAAGEPAAAPNRADGPRPENADASRRHAEALGEMQRKVAGLEEQIVRLKASGRVLISQRDAARDRSAELERMLRDLRAQDRPLGGGAHGDARFRETKAAFARLYHPDRLQGTSFERRLREEVFKEFWSEIERIEKG